MTDSRFYSHKGRAGIGRRAVALIIDTVIVSVVVVPIGYAIQQLFVDAVFDGASLVTAHGLAMLLYLAYFILLEARSGATLGKRIVGIRVLHLQGGRITMRESLIRNCLRVVDGFPFFFVPFIPPLYLVGGVMIMYTGHRQRLGDWAAETHVVLATAPQPAKHAAPSSHATPSQHAARRSSASRQSKKRR